MPEKPQRPMRPSVSGGGASKPGSAGSKPGPGGSRPGIGAAHSSRADVDRAMLLRDVMDHAVRVHKETTAPFARKKSQARAITLGTVTVVLLAFSAYSWVARPAFIWGPSPAPPPAVEQEAGMRFAMFLMSQRIKSFRESQGVLPSSPASIGEGIPGVTYVIVADTVFELRAAVAGKRLVLRSDQSADEFLGNSGNVIQGLGRP